MIRLSILLRACLPVISLLGFWIPAYSLEVPATKTDSSNYIRFIGELSSRPTKKKPIPDTLHYFNLFQKHLWQVTMTKEDGSVKTLSTLQADTLSAEEVREMVLEARFSFNEKLIPYMGAIRQKSRGSMQIRQNGILILETGNFTSDSVRASKSESERYPLPVFINDTLQTFKITFRPGAAIVPPDISLGSKQWGMESARQEHYEEISDLSTGFFFLAFGVVFIALFLYHLKARENFYFAMFCLSVAGYCLSKHLIEFQNTFAEPVFMMLLLEWLSVFFARIIKDAEKSKVPLLIAFFLGGYILLTPEKTLRIAFSHFDVFYGTFGLTAENVLPILFFIGVFIMIFYSVFSVAFYLIQGFWQKRWEAKTIVYICSVAVVLTFLSPIVLRMTLVPKGSGYDFVDLGSDVGFCLYPVAAAVVLGRRNKENQVQLLRQIDSIRQLSQQDLDREREKQEFLSRQKVELERMVVERTREVTQQKEEIESINRSITDNLNYARRIQSALLPDLTQFNKELGGLALVYYPKDIVSGDFYFFAKKEDCLVIAAGDCTGHGVSGAFMSMIGSSLLKQVVQEQADTDPAAILKELNTKVIDTFRQQQSETNDGMDIALCVLDRKTKELRFAGANRPLWILREDSLLTFDPDKAPIGGLQMARDRSFHNTNIPLTKGDTVYIFSDGYADQFGGERGKKMMTGKFREFLLDIRNEDLAVQEERLKSHFNNWKQGYDQVDDVLVIGFRV